MILVLATTIVACLTAWAYVRWVKVKSYWAQRGVPYIPPHPLYGSLTFLQKINPAVWMRQLYGQYQTPYVGIWLFWRPALVINCPEISRNILVKDSANFRNRFLNCASHDEIGSLNIFCANDPLWTSVRRRLTPAFTSSKLKSIQLLINDKAKDLVKRIAWESKKGSFDCRTMYNDYGTDVIGTASLGVKSEATLTGSSSLRDVTKDFEHYNLFRGIAWSCIFFFPELVGKFGFFPKKATDYFRKIYNIVVEERKAEINRLTDPRDLLDILMLMKRNSVLENKEIPDDVLIAQAAIFLQAGFDTSGSQLSFGTYELAYHPEFQAKLYNELKQAKEINGSDDFDESTLANLTYLNCVIKETLRKYSPMGWLDRKALNEYKIDDKLTIPAGTPTYINASGMHYDPKFYPEPTRFNPDRFLPSNEDNCRKSPFMPFGEGPRSCIGQRLGYTSVRSALTSIILNYELKAVPNTKKPTEIEIGKNSLLLGPGEPLYVDFIPRT